MAARLRTIHVDGSTELNSVLDLAGEGPLELERDGVRYRVEASPAKPWPDYDADAVRATLARLAGVLEAGEADRVIDSLYHAREIGSRSPDRP